LSTIPETLSFVSSFHGNGLYPTMYLPVTFSPKKSTPFKKVHRNYNSNTEKKAPKIVLKDKSQQQIDEILDKISQSGYDSLTKAEKEFLFKVGK